MTRTMLYILTPACIVYALLLVWQGVPQNLHAYTVAHPLEQPCADADHRAGARWLRRKPSRCWAPTAADSSTPTARIPMRIPRRFRTSCRFFPSSSFRRGLTYTLGPHDRLAGPWLGRVWRPCSCCSRPDFAVCYWAESQPHPLIHGAAAGAHCNRARRQHGGQGSSQRHRRKRALRHHHHRRQLRRGQQHARQLYAAGRHGAADQHHARRSGLRRRGRGPVRHVDLRRAGGLHRRTHGGPHARVPGQEDRSLRREDGHALCAHLPAHHSHLRRHLRAVAGWTLRRLPIPARTVSPRSSTPSPRARATTARPSRAWAPTGGTTSRWAGTCSSGASS